MIDTLSAGRRRAVFVCCDGLGREWITAARTPTLHALAAAGLWCADHRAVFPSVTRVSSASIATGCAPGRHGLHGNRMALIERGRLVVRDVGPPGFFDHLRRATGTTLRVPTLAERVARHGGFIGFSNVSPGAAYALDPEHHGHVYHRAGSFAPGGVPITGADALAVSHDEAGDVAMTERFCTEVLIDRRPTIAVLWLANPDLTLHGAPLGSPRHLAALQTADRCVAAVRATVARLRGAGADICLVVGSDHGQETIGACVDVQAWLADQGLGAPLEAGAIAVAAQGTAALLYALDDARPALCGVLDALRAQPWAGELVVGDALAARGWPADGGVVAALDMAREDAPNEFGVPGRRWAVAEPGKPAPIGCGQHGGWGRAETTPFLVIEHPRLAAGTIAEPTSLTTIAPTILAFLGLPHDDLDGRPLAAVAR